MIEDHDTQIIAVDRREETLITRHPGYSETEQVVHDVAAERRMRLFQFKRILWSMMVLLQVLLATRFLLRMIAANPDSGFVMLIYGVTGIFVGPFNGMIETPTPGGSPIEVTTLIAMVVYWVVFWGIVYAVKLVLERPSAYSFTRTTSEQTPGGEGNVRRTNTTISNRKM